MFYTWFLYFLSLICNVLIRHFILMVELNTVSLTGSTLCVKARHWPTSSDSPPTFTVSMFSMNNMYLVTSQLWNLFIYLFIYLFIHLGLQSVSCLKFDHVCSQNFLQRWTEPSSSGLRVPAVLNSELLSAKHHTHTHTHRHTHTHTLRLSHSLYGAVSSASGLLGARSSGASRVSSAANFILSASAGMWGDASEIYLDHVTSTRLPLKKRHVFPPTSLDWAQSDRLSLTGSVWWSGFSFG